MFSVVSIILASCASNECYDNKNSLPLAGFYSSDSVPQSISLDTITVYGLDVPGDSLLQDKVRGLSQCYLPFRIDQGSTSYVIEYQSGLLGEFGVADTITFNYDILPWFVSSACGVIYDYKMLSVETTHNVIDSVTCPSGEINNVNIENLKIYFRVMQEEEDEYD